MYLIWTSSNWSKKFSVHTKFSSYKTPRNFTDSHQELLINFIKFLNKTFFLIILNFFVRECKFTELNSKGSTFLPTLCFERPLQNDLNVPVACDVTNSSVVSVPSFDLAFTMKKYKFSGSIPVINTWFRFRLNGNFPVMK